MRPWIQAAAALAALAAALLSISCGRAPVFRRIALVAQPALPSGASSVVGGTLRISAGGLEPLKASSSYLAWAIGDTTTLLGKVEPGTTLAVALEASQLSAVRELRVTEETIRGALPTRPSTARRLSGSVGGELSFTPVGAPQAAIAAGEVQLTDGHLTVRTSGLPELEEGLRYAVWARFDCTETASASTGLELMPGMDTDAGEELDGGVEPDAGAEADAGEPPDAGASGATDGGARDAAASPDGAAPAQSPAAPETRVFLGTLDAQGALEADFPYLLASMQEVVLTVQSARADEARMSPVRILRGELKLPMGGGSAESSPTHTH